MKKEQLLKILPDIYDLIINDGLSIKYICKEVGLNRDSVAKALKEIYGHESEFAKYAKLANKADYETIDAIAYERYLDGESITKIAQDFQLKRQSLSKRLKEKYNLKIKNDNNKNAVNSDFFKKDSDEKYYWLGYFWADGNISSANTKIELSSKDYDVIEKFKTSLKSDHKISEKKVGNGLYYRISIQDSTLYNDLFDLGIRPNKSNFESGFPSLTKGNFFSFLRGYIDGDGTYQKRDNRVIIGICIGKNNLIFAEWLQSTLLEYGISAAKLYEFQTAYQISIQRKADVLKIVNYMYKDNCISMDRKYEKIKCLL